MKKYISVVSALFIRELRRLSKDFDIISIILLAPLGYSLLYASFYMYKAETKVPVVIVDRDNTPGSLKLKHLLDSHRVLNVSGELQDFSAAQELLHSDKAQAVIYIPEGFSADLKTDKPAPLKVYLNTQRFLPSNDINKAVNEAAMLYAKDKRIKIFEAKGFNREQAEAAAEPLKEDIRFVSNPSETYGDFLIPAIFILIMQQTLLMGLCESVALEKEENKFRALFRHGRGNLTGILTGKTLFYFIVFFAFALFYYSVEFSIFKVHIAGNIIPVIMLTVIFLAAVILQGFTAATFFHSKMFALQVIAFTSYPVFFISGYVWPANTIPGIVRFAGGLIPLTPFLRAYTRILQFNAGITDVMPEIINLAALLAAGVIMYYLRMNFLRKKLHRQA